MQGGMSPEELSARIAETITRKLIQENLSGRLNLSGFIDGDSAPRIDFGSFDVSGFGHEQHARHDAVFRDDLAGTMQIEQDADVSPVQIEYVSPRRTRPSNQRRVAPGDDSDSSEETKRRKLTGGLRLAVNHSSPREEDEPDSASGRQLQPGSRLPQRKPPGKDEHAMKPSTLNKLIIGIWEQIFSSISFDMGAVVDEWHEARGDQGLIVGDVNSADSSPGTSGQVTRASTRAFSQMNILCRKISQASRVSRALEVIVQARWVELYDARIEEILAERPEVSRTKAKMAALAEACQDFSWTAKELRNRLAIWRGYQQIKDEGGYVCLVFAGMGIYRFCKYRVEFTPEAMQTLRRYRTRFEVAADTLHPQWRQLLSIVDAASPRLYTGHPHDWVVSDYGGPPVPLTETYLQWDPGFAFTHLDTSEVDVHAWGASDPRMVTSLSHETAFVCNICGETQSDNAAENNCCCFPNLYGNSHIAPAPVQVFRTKNGKNNGLIACCPFERGHAIGEFLGLITKGLEGVDIMQAAADQGRYQIWQGRGGNHTKFVNHSCRPNSQFQRFVWMGVQRVVLVSKGIEAGQEITVDYSDSYWRNLEKICLCNEPCCRFKDRGRVRSIS